MVSTSARASARRRRLLSAGLLGASLLAACGGTGGGPPEDGSAADAHTAPVAAHEPAHEIPESVRLTGAAIAEAGIETWKVEPVDLARLLVLTGSVGHDENRLLHVAANVRGRVVSIPVDLGSAVRKGDPLVWIESVELSHAWEEFVKSLANLHVARRALERARALLDARAISAAEVQAREAGFLSRKAEAETAERTLRMYGEPEEEIAAARSAIESNTEVPVEPHPHRLAIRSPFDGRVIERKVTPGSLVEALEPLVTVADLTTVWVFLQAHEKDLALLRESLPVTILTETYPEEAFGGRVDFLGSVVDEATRTVRVRATVSNRREKLRPGMFVRARVEVPRPREEARPALAVPHAALQTLEGRTHVFVQAGPGIFVRRAIETGRTFEGFVEVLSGVKAGEVVVTEGSFVLKGEFARATLAEEH